MQKGQVVPEHVKAQHKLALHKNFISSLDFEGFKKYYDTELSLKSRNKLAKELTLGVYCSLLQSGKSAKDIIREGYDKHLIAFYNALLQHKLDISEEQFTQDYLSGMSLDEMAKKYHADRGNMTYLREFYGIKRKGATYINRKQTEEPLTQQQKELIYGSLMGDGKRMSDSSFSVKHTAKAAEYVLWKYMILKNVASEKSLKKEEITDMRSGSVISTMRFYTHANSDIEKIIREFYGSGKKRITQEILDNLSAFSLSVWYMDDGKIDWCHKSRKRGWNAKPSITLCTESFTYEEHQLILDWFKQKFNIEARIRKHRKGTGYRLKFSTVETEKFIQLVKPYIVPYMMYKVDYNCYLIKRKMLGFPD